MDHLNAALDHVAIAVPDPQMAAQRWRTELGAGTVSRGNSGAFDAWQLRFAGGGKLELLSPAGPDGGFVARYLERFGTGIHHVTLKVPDLPAALETVRAAGLDTVDVQLEDPWWQEAFLRPSQIGGLIVQVAWARGTDEDWAANVGYTPEPARDDAATLLGATLRHPDLDRAAALWSLLGATVDRAPDGLRCAWPDSALDLHISAGEPAGPVFLRASGCAPLDADPALGPAVRVPA